MEKKVFQRVRDKPTHHVQLRSKDGSWPHRPEVLFMIFELSLAHYYDIHEISILVIRKLLVCVYSVMTA